jgi:hypothetical protein
MPLNNYLDNSEIAERIFIANGQVVNTSFVHKFGAVPAMSIGTAGTIWDKNDTLYPWSAFDTPGILTITTNLANGSTSTLDNGKSILISGLDENYNPVSETITISGSSGTGTTTFARVFRAYTSDTNLTQFRVSRGATEVLRVNIGKAQTLMSIYTVPSGYTGFLCKGIASIEYGGDATIDMFARYGGTGAFRIGHTGEVAGTGMPYNYEFTIPIKMPEKTDIDVRAAVRSNNSRVTAAFDLILVKK